MYCAGALALSILIYHPVSERFSIDSIDERGRIITFALQRVRATFVPAQLRISVANREGSGESIGRPLMPITKSYHGSIAMSSFLLRRTWKPTALGLVLECRDCPSESRREMNRLRAPNIVMFWWGKKDNI